MNKEYLQNIRNLLDKMEETQCDTIDAVAEACAQSIKNGGLLYFFGTGHSHMICEEPFYRAGGLAAVYPILESTLMLHEGGSKSSIYERLEGIGNIAIAQNGVGKGDVVFLISNSGRNCACIDAALEAKKLGAVTVAITSLNHSNGVTSRHPNGKRLFEVCDYVLDNGGVIGDACVNLEGLNESIAPTSTVLDVTMVNMVIVNTVEKLLAMGVTPPVFTSANTDKGDSANKSIIEEYKKRVKIL
ncbi:MAG: SIS domain-containing protein [Clostridia bacterium]|nr:SIS domain-containing protein [Clostridia bacterium]